MTINPKDVPSSSLRPVSMAMMQPDDVVITFDYRDANGVSTHRAVSPIRFLDSKRFLALCLGREEPRQFYLSRCSNLKLEPAYEFLMPVKITKPQGDEHGSPNDGR